MLVLSDLSYFFFFCVFTVALDENEAPRNPS